MKNPAPISNVFRVMPLFMASALAVFRLSAQSVSTVDYYLRGDSGYAPLTSETTSLKYWSLTRDEYTAPDSLPGADAMVIIDRVNTNGSSTFQYARGDIHKATTYYAIRATVNTELNMTFPLSLVSDFSINSVFKLRILPVKRRHKTVAARSPNRKFPDGWGRYGALYRQILYNPFCLI